MTIHEPRAGRTERPPSLRQILKAETRASHDALDRGFSAMLDHLDFDAYRLFIRVSHACHGAVEASLAGTALPSIVGDWPQRSRMPALDHDMGAMALAPIAVPAFRLDGHDLAGAFGAAYVLEGSRVGARYVHRQFIEARVGEIWPGATFAFVANDAGVSFRDFTEILNAHARDEAHQRGCIAGANRAFDFFAAVAAAEIPSIDRPASVA